MVNPVNSQNEWDRLEEVIVGRADFACLPSYTDPDEYFCGDVTDVSALRNMLGVRADNTYGADRIKAANDALDGLSKLLQAEGVTVRRPDPFAFNKQVVTPIWSTAGGYNGCNPRDVILVVGDMLIECPMSSRERYFEAFPYRSLLKEYFRQGAKWIAAPKPTLSDAIYEGFDEEKDFWISEHEPCFDAADFVRCGSDIVGQLSHVTNKFGVEWLQRTLGPDFNVHLVESRDSHAFHIDTTFMPLAEGRVLVNPEFLNMESIPDAIKHWEFLIAPEPVPHPHSVRGFVSNWIAMNVLSLDERRVIVDYKQKPLIAALKQWGFEPIEFDISPAYAFGGGFHCVTLDIRRAGQSS